jgi:hypothetical protein
MPRVVRAGLLFIWVASCLGVDTLVFAESNAATPSDEEHQWLEPIPVPADPELEDQILEIQGALSTLHQQTVRRKEALKHTQDAASKATLYEELEVLRKERQELEALLHHLVEEARLSEQTAIDEALAQARWLERQQERHEQREELIRDRQE